MGKGKRGTFREAIGAFVEQPNEWIGVTYISRFFAKLNLFALAGKTSPAFPQYSNKG